MIPILTQNTSKDIKLDSENAYSKPEFAALSNGAEISSKFLKEIHYFTTLRSINRKIKICALETA
jgi:hypothetical protein